MKHLKKNSLGTIAPFLILNTARAEALLFSCLHGVEVVSDYLRNDVAIRGGVRRNTFSIRIQKLLEKNSITSSNTSSRLMRRFLISGKKY